MIITFKEKVKYNKFYHVLKEEKNGLEKCGSQLKKKKKKKKKKTLGERKFGNISPAHPSLSNSPLPWYPPFSLQQEPGRMIVSASEPGSPAER